MKINERREAILDKLRREGKINVASLSKALNTSVVTIRSDLAALEKENLLQRIPGGAVQSVLNTIYFDSLQRTSHNAQYKQSLAAAVVTQIQDGDTLFINSGATMVYVAQALKHHKRLNIVTNAIQIAMELGSVQGFRVILLGGDINVQYGFIYGTTCIDQLSFYKADCCILSIDGVHPEAGLTTYHSEETMIDRTMIERSSRTIVAADQSKLLYESFSKVAPLSMVNLLVTNACAPAVALDRLRKKISVITDDSIA